MTAIKSLKTLVIPILIMALITGFAAAYWSEQLVITGDITTTEFHADVSLPWPLIWDDNEEIKDVANIIDADTEGPKKIVVVIDNAYPCYECWIKVGVHIMWGSMPGIIKDIIIDAPPELDVWVEPYTLGQTIIGQQLHECQEFFMKVYCHVVEIEGEIEPEQGTTYTFTVTIVMAQYNAPTG